MTPIYFEFKDKGSKIVGKLKGVAAVQSSLSAGTYNQYLMEADAGLTKFHLGAAVDKEVAPMMRVDQIYYIEYLGKVKISGGRSVNKFKVLEIDPALFDAEDKA